jgi:hypothetical protein
MNLRTAWETDRKKKEGEVGVEVKCSSWESPGFPASKVLIWNLVLNSQPRQLRASCPLPPPHSAFVIWRSLQKLKYHMATILHLHHPLRRPELPLRLKRPPMTTRSTWSFSFLCSPVHVIILWWQWCDFQDLCLILSSPMSGGENMLRNSWSCRTKVAADSFCRISRKSNLHV